MISNKKALDMYINGNNADFVTDLRMDKSNNTKTIKNARPIVTAGYCTKTNKLALEARTSNNNKIIFVFKFLFSFINTEFGTTSSSTSSSPCA